ncbi:MAG: hypothetical protein ABSG15_00475 [FCB group bacterium]|jgi:hypothetical protein
MFINSNNLGIFVGTITFIVASLSFYISLRSEIRKNTEKMLQSKLNDEKRHASHERRVAIIEERMSNIDNKISYKLGDIQLRITDLSCRFDKHINEENYE